MKPRTSLIGSTDDILCPKSVKLFDYEAELALVIGKKCRKVTLKDALDYVAGYFIMNDISARDVQFTDRQYTVWTVANYPDGISDPSNLHITTKVNGEVLISSEAQQTDSP